MSSVAIAERAQVTGDRELLTQLFANLIENAIRHSPKGTLRTSDKESIVLLEQSAQDC